MVEKMVEEMVEKSTKGTGLIHSEKP